MTKTINLLLIVLLLVPAVLHGAPQSEQQGWWFSERFQGNSNTAGVVLKENSTLGYTFNGHVQAYAGLPVYFTRENASNTTSGKSSFVNGIGNAYTGFLISASNDSLRYTSDLVLTAPTGDRANGFSTGHVTADWTNTFSHAFSGFTPYGSAGMANTISDTEFFVRPFTTQGVALHFEGGVVFKLVNHLNAGASTYAVHAAGQQEIVSKVVNVPTTQPTQSPTTTKSGVVSTVTKAVGVTSGSGKTDKTVFETTHQTVTTADAVDDHGFSTWLSLRPKSVMDFQIGYSHSVAYQLNSLFFGVGFRSGH
jgi:hypothetical protein